MASREKIKVKEVYDKIAKKYHSERIYYKNKNEISEFINVLPKKSKILDVGCGAGVPVTKALIEAGFDVVGIDLSESMLKLARKNVPKAKFFKKDMIKIDFEDNSFDGLAAFYTIFHVSKEKHKSIFQNFHKILRPNGLMMINFGTKEDEGVQDFFGERMYWSNYAPKKTLKLIKNAGFEILLDEVRQIEDEEHYWILAKNIK